MGGVTKTCVLGSFIRFRCPEYEFGSTTIRILLLFNVSTPHLHILWWAVMEIIIFYYFRKSFKFATLYTMARPSGTRHIKVRILIVVDSLPLSLPLFVGPPCNKSCPLNPCPGVFASWHSHLVSPGRSFAPTMPLAHPTNKPSRLVCRLWGCSTPLCMNVLLLSSASVILGDFFICWWWSVARFVPLLLGWATGQESHACSKFAQGDTRFAFLWSWLVIRMRDGAGHFVSPLCTMNGNMCFLNDARKWNGQEAGKVRKDLP